MFELEALFLGLEPLTALAIGVGALLLAPLASATASYVSQHPEMTSSVGESVRGAAKQGLIFTFEAAEKTQGFFAEASECLQDLVAEAKSDLANQKAQADSEPREVTIVAE